MLKILLVEDDLAVARVITRALTSSGHQVTHAVDGREALQRCDEMAPEVVITDILMPDMDGLELIDALRRRRPQLGIVAISGGGSRGTTLHLDTAAKFGARRVLPKPFSISELLAAVDAAAADEPVVE
jgi:CheY-like chemotaxis protein